MRGAQSISTRRAYGVQRVCRVWHCARLQRVWAPPRTTSWSATSAGCSRPRRFMAKDIGKPGRSCGSAGVRTAKERVRRLLREHALQAPQRAGHAHGPKAHDGTITTEAPDVMWGTDMTATVTGAEGAACVFVAVDHCATECIGLHAAKRGNRFEAMEPIRQGIRERFGGISEGVAQGAAAASRPRVELLGRRFPTGDRVLRH